MNPFANPDLYHRFDMWHHDNGAYDYVVVPLGDRW